MRYDTVKIWLDHRRRAPDSAAGCQTPDEMIARMPRRPDPGRSLEQGRRQWHTTSEH